MKTDRSQILSAHWWTFRKRSELINQRLILLKITTIIEFLTTTTFCLTLMYVLLISIAVFMDMKTITLALGFLLIHIIPCRLINFLLIASKCIFISRIIVY